MSTPVGKTPRRGAEVAKSPLPMKPPAAPLEVIDLEAETAQVREARPWRVHGQSAKTLVKHEHFRLVLVAMKRGRHCREHTAEESVSVQALDGHVEVHVASGDPIELVGGQVLALAPGVAHDFEALEDSTLLLTLAWTGHRPDRPPRAGRRGTAH
jgi:quercetin dioxygenase-like cupin family protein